MVARLSDQQVMKILRAALGSEGHYGVIQHAIDEMLADGFTDNDVRHAIQLGKMTRREPHMRGDERFTIEGPRDPDTRKQVGCVCKIVEPDPPEILVVTVFDVSTGYGRRR